MRSVYFHVDLDAFFASVEQNENPELRGKPVIIGAAPGHRGVVSACSYEARTFGVHSAMPISEAYRRCPKGIYLPVRMHRYHEVSVKVMALFGDYTPYVRQISVDEASLDMTGTQRIFGKPKRAAELIKKRVRDETGLTISIGIAPNRYLAKLASDYDKPDGLCEICDGEEIAFLDTFELSGLWGIGKKTLARLDELGIRSVPELRALPLEFLQTRIGHAAGTYLHTIVRGKDPGIYRPARKSHSISNERTFEFDTNDSEEIMRTLLALSLQVMERLRDEHAQPRTVFLKVRFADFRTTTVQHALSKVPDSAEELFAHAKALLEERWRGEPLRLLGVGLSASVEPRCETVRQGELFEGLTDAGTEDEREHLAGGEGRRPAGDKRGRLEETVHRMKLAGNRLTKASLLPKKDRKED